MILASVQCPASQLAWSDSVILTSYSCSYSDSQPMLLMLSAGWLWPWLMPVHYEALTPPQQHIHCMPCDHLFLFFIYVDVPITVLVVLACHQALSCETELDAEGTTNTSACIQLRGQVNAGWLFASSAAGHLTMACMLGTQTRPSAAVLGLIATAGLTASLACLTKPVITQSVSASSVTEPSGSPCATRGLRAVLQLLQPWQRFGSARPASTCSRCEDIRS